MNFLAHLYLSPDDEDILLGNFIADAVKGKTFDNYKQSVKNGILLHRKIDKYTDNHPIFKKSSKRLNGKYRKYSGVIVDIFYDHFLAANWHNYSDVKIEEFVSKAYGILIKNILFLPKKSKRILPFMITQNWLVNYANFKGLQRVFNGMSQRTPFNSGMESAVNDLKKDYELYEKEFSEFFPEIIEYVKDYNDILSTFEV